jgi:hypothetical protein
MAEEENPYLTFRTFNDPSLAEEMAALLEEHGIDYLMEDTSGFDPTFSFNAINQEYSIKLKQEDFIPAGQLLLRHSETQIEQVGEDYYLFEFSDEELMEVLAKPHEWSEFDYSLAQKILKKRGAEVRPAALEQMREQHVEELARPEELSSTWDKVWLWVGYISACLGGLLGIFIGIILSTFKKQLPDGSRVYAYNDSLRRHGRRITIIGIVILICSLLLRWL